MEYSEIESKVRKFSLFHGISYDLRTDTKKHFHEVRLEKDGVQIGFIMDFQTISMCKVDIVSNTLNSMLRKVNDRLKELNLNA